MAQGDTPITIVGNVVADPELKYTPAGAAVANFRVASTPKKFNRDSGQWEEQEGLFLTCNAWKSLAENVTESLSKGMRVIVTGVLRQRSYETREGERRTVYEIEVDAVGPDLRFATAQVTRNPRSGSQGGGGAQQQAGHTWNQGGQPQGGFGGGFGGGDETPPF